MVTLFITGFSIFKFSGQPIIVRISSVGEILPLIDPLPFGLFADSHPFQVFGIGKVDIETSQRRQSLFQYPAAYLTNIRSCRLKIGILVVVA